MAQLLQPAPAHADPDDGDISINLERPGDVTLSKVLPGATMADYNAMAAQLPTTLNQPDPIAWMNQSYTAFRNQATRSFEYVPDMTLSVPETYGAVLQGKDNGNGSITVSMAFGYPTDQGGVGASSWRDDYYAYVGLFAAALAAFVAGVACQRYVPAPGPAAGQKAVLCGTVAGAFAGFAGAVTGLAVRGAPFQWVNVAAVLAAMLAGALSGVPGTKASSLASELVKWTGETAIPAVNRAIGQVLTWVGVGAATVSSTSAAVGLVATNITPAFRFVNVGGLFPSVTTADTISAPNGKCVDAAGDDNGTNGTAVQMWDCHFEAADQHWTHTADGQLHTLGRCMGVAGDSHDNFAKIQLWDCNTAPGEIWIQQQNGSLRNPNSGKCLDDPQWDVTNGVQLQIYDCIGSQAQQFFVNGANAIAANGGKCLDVAGDDLGGNLAPVQLWDCQATAIDQHWIHDADGRLRTLGQCLDIAGNGTSNNTKVELFDCNSVGGQIWNQQPDGSLLNPQSGKCLDDPNGNTASGTPLQIFTCNGAAAQKFHLS